MKDSIYVAQPVAEVEAALDVCLAEVATEFVVGECERHELGARLPGHHRDALHEAVGDLTAEPGPEQLHEDALAEDEAARLGEDLGAETVLERYARWRRFDTAALAAGFDAFVRLFSNDIAPVRIARDLGMAAVNRIGPLRRAFMQEAGGATGDLPMLLRGETV